MTSSLSSTLAFGSEEDTEQLCQPCDKAGRRVFQNGYCTTCEEYLCTDCFSNHKKAESRRNHKLRSNDEMLTSKRSTLYDSGTFDEMTTPCERHRDHMVSFYCQSHEVLICDLCKSSEHASRNCSVLFIPNISKQALDGKDYSETNKYLEAFIRGSEKVRDKFEKISTKNNTSLEESVQAMKDFRRLLNEKLDDIEKVFMIEVKNKSQNSYMKMREIESTCNNAITSTRKILENVKKLNESKQGNRLFIELKQVRQTMTTNMNVLEKVSTDAVEASYEFEPNKTLEQLIVMQEKSIGNLVSKMEDSNQQRKICAKMSDECNKCWITGMTMMSPNVLICSDFLNKSVKMVNVNNNMVTRKVSVNSPPYDIAKVSTDEVAVSAPEDGHIMFINVAHDKLALKGCLKVDGKFCRISFCPDRGFVVSYDNPAKIAILDKKGDKLLTVAKDTKGKDIFASPDDITASFDYIFVSDRTKKSIIRLSWKGEVTSIYSGELKSPQGLALSTVDGSVFVCDNSSNSFLAISPDFKKSEVLITNINRPCYICYCDKTKQLFTSTSTRNKAFDNYIHINKLTK